MTIRVLLADDQPWLRLGFRAVLEQEPDLEVVGEAGDGAQAVAQTRALRPDVVLMDVRMPAMDGIEATQRIADSGSAARVLVLTTFDLDEYVYAALRAGASGFLLKDALPAELLNAIRVVASGEAAVAPGVLRRLISAFAAQAPQETAARTPLDALAALTARERDVLLELARARSNAEIGARLHITEATVKVHVGRVLTKLGLRDRAHAVVFAYENGVIRTGAS
ncbi:response regulator [Nonomuraea typhae]|uniref:response regulator n=1 Tax=Nonomuraea typhae TaxID=2603600 RepID=UPI0012F7FC6E|nr:response regulator transcription factor [Nonomuraea typhae]